MPESPQTSIANPAPDGKIAAVYCRISGEDQSVFSLSTQQEACLALAAQRGYSVPESHVLIDNGVSGSTLERPALRQLRSLVQAQAITAVICLDPDRLSRNLGHMLFLEEECKRAGVELHFVYFPREDTPEGKLMLSVRGAVAEYERAKILQRSWSGKLKRAQGGHAMTYKCTPYGYRYLPPDGKHHGRLEIDETEADVVRRIYAWRLSGLGVMKIVRLLSAEGIPTRSDMGGGISPKSRARGVWAPSTVHRMLRSETYVGRMHFNKRKFFEPDEAKRRKPRNDKRPQTAERQNPRAEWITIPCPAIIDEPTWNAVQILLDNGKTTSPRRRTREYLFLNGRLRCGRCDSGMSGFFWGKKNARFYRCSGTHHNAELKCWNTLRAEPFEEECWEVMRVNLLDEPAFFRQELERRQERISERRGVTTRDVETIEGKIQALRARLSRFQTAYGDGVLTLDDFRKIKIEHDAELAALERLRTELQGNIDQDTRRQREIEAAVDFLRRVKAELPTYSLVERRRVLELLDVRVIYTHRHTSRMYFAIPAEEGLDARLSFYAGDAFAAKWGYTADPSATPSEPGKG